MPKKRILSPKSIWDVEQVSEAFRSANIKDVHIKKLYGRLAKDPYVDLDDIDGFPESAKRLLDGEFVRMTSTCKSVKRSADGETTKLLIELQDGKSIEAVIMMYDTTKRGEGGRGETQHLGDDVDDWDEAGHASSAPSTSGKGGTGGKRYTLCVSSEVGCQMGCTFCATGTMGLQADLTSAEIVEQLVHARLRATPPRNIVFMGMGEPMNNYEQVRRAISLMIDGAVFAMRRQCVTLSTVGVIPRIKQMASDLPGVSLAHRRHRLLPGTDQAEGFRRVCAARSGLQLHVGSCTPIGPAPAGQGGRGQRDPVESHPQPGIPLRGAAGRRD
jgi:adenine C2-methylase RlmN of 23S rRNA A2503 and tRNA A37